ncbi:ion transporter [Phlyctema vagabunda]|uniref:Ion transporter n=1 Tax=Phlyctema vagabunda TaxID=108571 RepID=A0ABR4P9Q3_9HELO
MTPLESPVEEKRSLHLPEIGQDDAFVTVVKSLSVFFVDEIQMPSTFEQLRTTSAGYKIRALVDHLVLNVTNPALINALLTLKWHFTSLDVDDRGINETRANACEIVAWRFLSRIAERDAVDYCLYELPPKSSTSAQPASNGHDEDSNEHSLLLPQFRAQEPHLVVRPGSKKLRLMRSISHLGGIFTDDEEDEEDPTDAFTSLNGLEIAAVADCKKFLSQRIVQKIITGIWNGDITFWESLSLHTIKKPQFYNKRHSDPFTRLRVPRYIKTFEVLFFASFLFLYYAVLVERNPYKITSLETILYIWFAAFTYDELSEFIDAGSIFYAVDIWNSCDIAIILIGIAFLITRVIGIIKDSDPIIDIAFDILSLEALFMVPRICSLLSLHPYFGTLIPCLKEMTKDFVKFMVIVVILYLGFLTTFTLLARDSFSLTEMTWILIKVFFGSSYIGFDIMERISPQLGPPLMLIFVFMTNILLVTSLISILSDSFSKVISHAREEYLFVYSVYVLEASTSNRLTHFYPPLNLIPLVFIRPLRLFVRSEDLRNARIILLRITHAPIVAAIFLFERAQEKVGLGAKTFSSIGPGTARLAVHTDSEGNTTAKKQKPFLTNRAQPKPASRGEGALSPGEACFSRTKSHDGKEVVAAVDNSAMEEKVNELSREVKDLSQTIKELTALLMAQQAGSAEDL